MPTTLKVLGQSAPAAATDTDLYTVPAATTTVVSTITICNRTATAATFRVWVAIAGAATANAQYICYDVALDGNELIALTLGLSLGATDVIRVRASTADVSFAAYGQENT